MCRVILQNQKQRGFEKKNLSLSRNAGLTFPKNKASINSDSVTSAMYRGPCANSHNLLNSQFQNPHLTKCDDW